MPLLSNQKDRRAKSGDRHISFDTCPLITHCICYWEVVRLFSVGYFARWASFHKENVLWGGNFWGEILLWRRKEFLFEIIFYLCYFSLCNSILHVEMFRGYFQCVWIYEKEIPRSWGFTEWWENDQKLIFQMKVC